MGRIAVVGGSGNVASIVIDAILKKGNHEVTILSRKSQAPSDLASGVKFITADYNNHASLVAALKGIDTVLSFVTSVDGDEAVRVEKGVIDAAIEAGVKRFAPSQWAAKTKSNITHYAFKDKVSDYLASVNKGKKVIQYTLFQPGFFVDYLAYPHATNPKFANLQMMFDFEHRRAIIMSGSEDSPITLTSVSDMALVVAEALDYSGDWPEVGGMQGSQTTVKDIIRLGEKLRGPFEVSRVDPKKSESGDFDTPWYPILEHPMVTDENRESLSKWLLKSYVTCVASGGWSVTDEWNKALGIKLTSMEEFLTKYWS